MKVLLAMFREVCLLKRGPQDLPHSTGLLAGVLLVDFALSAIVTGRFGGTQGGALPLAQVAVMLGVMLALPWLALRIAGLAPRFVQTATALVATDIVFTLLALPVLLGIGPIPATPEQITLGQAMLSLVGLTLLVWQTAVRGNILRHALDASFAIGVLIAIGFLIVERLLGGWLFAATAAS